MASPDPDLQTDLRKRARRRLLGAIALALTAAIVLPIVMDHEPRAPAQDIAVRIPSPDSVPALASPARSETIEPDVVLPPAPPDSEPVAPGAGDGARATPVPPPPVEAPAVPAKPEAVKPETPKAPPPAAAPSAAEASRAAALLAGKPESFALQLGVFSDAANVAKLRAKAKELGLTSFTEEVRLADGQTRTRVKVGPFPSRASAEAAQRKLETIGLRSMLSPRA